MSTAELKTIGTGTDAMIAQATEAMESFRPMVANVREHECLTVEANGIGKVSDARKSLKRLRVDIDRKRSELNKGALEFQRTVNSIAKELTKPVEEVEDILQAREDAHEAKKEAERRAKFEAEEKARQEAEAAKQAVKQARVNLMIANGVTVDWVAAELPDEVWAPWIEAASQEAAVLRARIEEEARIARELEEKQRIEHEAETKRQAEELRIRAEEIERQRIADEAAMAEQRKAMEAEKEQLRKQQEEMRQSAIAKEQAERREAEQARADALKPEIEQATIFCDAVLTNACLWFEAHGEKKWTARAIIELQEAKKCILFQIGEMI
jgi:hypothetical protein